MKYKIEYLVNVGMELGKIDITKHNPITTYLIARNSRKVSLYISEFEDVRKKVVGDSWFQDFQELSKTDEDGAKEKYKEQLNGADEEIREVLNKEVEFSFYTRKIEEVSFENSEIIKFMDLIGE